MTRKLLLPLILMTLAASAFGDIARPEKTPKASKHRSIDTHLSIKLDRQAKEAVLVIPSEQVRELRAALDSLDGGDPLVTASISRLQTIVSGIFISLALAFAGVWLVRSGRTRPGMTKTSAGILIVLIGGALVTLVYGNAGPPADARKITGKMFAPVMHIYKFGGGQIKLEVSDSASTPVLIVPDPEEQTKPGNE